MNQWLPASNGFISKVLISENDWFSKAFEVLNEREKQIIKLRKLNDNPLKLEDLSKRYKISRERVRQIEEKALEKIQKEISNIR